jgi:hypothetical protein
MGGFAALRAAHTVIRSRSLYNRLEIRIARLWGVA